MLTTLNPAPLWRSIPMAKALRTASKWDVHVSSDLYYGPRNEDGERPVLVAHYVVLENEHGDRYKTVRTFDTQVEAEAHLLRAIPYLLRGASPATSPKWYRANPVYGSPAYVAYGAAEEVALERKEASYEPLGLH